MNESISRAAGSEWGQEMPPEAMEALIRSAGRTPRQRTTTYGEPPADQVRRSFGAAPLAEPLNPPVRDAGCGGRRSCCAPRRSRAEVVAHDGRLRRIASAAKAGTRQEAEATPPGALERVPERVRGPGPCTPRPWPTSRCSGASRPSASRGGVSRSSRWTPAASPPAAKSVRAERLGERRASGPRGPPQRGLVPRRLRVRADRLERAVRQRVGDDEVRDAELSPRSAEQSRLCRSSSWTGGRGPAERRRALERVLIAHGVDEPDPPLVRERVGGARVAGSSTIHEKPASPRSSQSSIRTAPA